ncbi:MAG: hypothetical protein V4603_08140 [Pseudomonadota bacterium]
MPHIPFASSVELLQVFITQRAAIVERVDQLLNCQKKPMEYQQDVLLLDQLFKDCFYAFPGITHEQARLRNQLEIAHWASGFKPRTNPGNDIIDAVQLMVRGFHFWRQTRWPGQKGRVRYAHTLFTVYLVRCLALLNMRLWDAGTSGVSDRLAQVQGVLDQLWRSSPADQPVLVRDVRWLFPVAMSPTTDDLTGYFDIAAKIAETFSAEGQLETQKAAVQTGGGHLRSQLYHLSKQQGVPLDDHSLVLTTRVSNALDISLLMEGLVTLLQAYDGAIQRNDAQQRLTLAAAICEGLSPDPELFVNRLDLLGPYTMIEHLFITVDDAGHASYTPMGQRHLQLLHNYKELVVRLASALHEDCQHNRPQAGSYSPYGALYGFSSNLLELIAFKTLQLDAATHLSLEDVFAAGAADKVAWVNGWRNLPHIKPEVVKQFEYPAQFAEDIHARVERALQQRVSATEASTVHTGRMFITSEGQVSVGSQAVDIAELSSHYVVSSDPQLVAANKAEPKDQEDLLYCRLEGEFLVSYPTPHGWAAITKDMLTEVVGNGHEVKLPAMPTAAQEVVALMCPELIAVER